MESHPTNRAAVRATIIPPAAQAALELLARQRRTCVALIDPADASLPAPALPPAMLVLLRSPDPCE